jgi:hypothetical protein
MRADYLGCLWRNPVKSNVFRAWLAFLYSSVEKHPEWFVSNLVDWNAGRNCQSL